MRLLKPLIFALAFICVGQVAAFTYFDYNYSESEGLKGMASPLCMNRAQLQKWDKVVQAEVEKAELSYFVYARLLVRRSSVPVRFVQEQLNR